MQTTIAITLLILAAAFLGWNMFGKKGANASDQSDDCGPTCNCS